MSELKDNLTQILREKQEKIIPGNIRKDIQIFGVVGNYDIGTYKVKLFETVEEMQADTTAQEGDLALVYGFSPQNMVDGDENVSSIYFPETVTLPTPVTTSYMYDSSGTIFDRVSITLNSTSFNMSYGVLGKSTIEYTSADGTTYTRTTQVTNPITLSQGLSADSNAGWDDILGYFMQIDKYAFFGLYKYSGTQYELAPTQLTASADVLYNATAYGKEGIIKGTLLNDISNSFADINAMLYYKLQQSYNNMSPRVLTDTDKEIDSNIYFIPVKEDGTPLLDTSKVTNMDAMFNGCHNLKTIPLLDTSNATNMRYMFGFCDGLRTIPLLDTSKVTSMGYMFTQCTGITTIPLLDTSQVTNMRYMFENCTSLTTIPELNTSQVTDMYGMFNNCTSLTSIPQLDTGSVTYMSYMFFGCATLTDVPLLDTSKVTSMPSMFNGCTSLVIVPVLDTSSVTNMSSMFESCSNLSDDSLNNILQMCVNATKISSSNKTLQYIKLSEEQATKCTTLSNYEAFKAAGWKTGYTSIDNATEIMP